MVRKLVTNIRSREGTASIMILILSSPEDILANEVYQRLNAGASRAVRLNEIDLFSATPFALQIGGQDRHGFVQCAGTKIALAQISGILMRLPRCWWPSLEFDLQDQLFVYHETTSAWFCLLSGLPCPVVNRFGLGWWVHDLTYPEQLRQSLAQRLDLNTNPCLPLSSPVNRLFPTPVAPSSDSNHVYLVGERILPRTSQDAAVAALLTQQASALMQWRQENDLAFCRLDFEQADSPRLTAVEPFPLLDGEQDELVGEISEQIGEILS